MGKLLTANEIIAAKDLAEERVDVPEWGGEVILRSLSAFDRESVEAETTTTETTFDSDGRMRFLPHIDQVKARAKFLARAIVDENGNRIFDDSQMEGLAKKSNVVIARLYLRAQELSGMTPQAVEDAEKNSASVPSDASSTA